MTIHSKSFTLLVALFGVCLSALLAKPYAGAWNDGSRLAAIESLGERGTYCIDESIYLHPSHNSGVPPYPADNALLMAKGTLDKLIIGGHFYSDKTPIPAALMAASYKICRWLGLPSAAERPDLFAWSMTFLWSGGSLLAALLALHFIGRRLSLPMRDHLLLLFSFAAATVNLAYVEQVNNHIFLLGAAMPLLALLMQPIEEQKFIRLFCIGGLAGFAYTIDLGVGPPMVALLFAYLVLYRYGGQSFGNRFRKSFFVLAGCLPFVLAHHVVNFEIAGTFGPANANAAYFDWPGCPFNVKNMTGGWKHASIGKAVLYAADLLVGKKGFLFHNLPLCVGLIFVARFFWAAFFDRKTNASLQAEWRGAFLFGFAWSAATWLLYAISSNNLSGMCCSIRWFVPLLAPGFLAVALALREMPRLRIDLAILTFWGSILAIVMAVKGPWTMRLIPCYWFIVAGALLSWGCYSFQLFQSELKAKTRESQSSESLNAASSFDRSRSIRGLKGLIGRIR